MTATHDQCSTLVAMIYRHDALAAIDQPDDVDLKKARYWGHRYPFLVNHVQEP